MWIYFFIKDVRFIMAKMADKRPKLFIAFCLCCKRKDFKEKVLSVKRHEKDIEVINEIEDLASGKLLLILDLDQIKYKYVNWKFFSSRWEF